MVLPESDMMSQGEVESPLQTDQQPKNNQYSSIGRQSSIYSLTLDEFQNTLCENGKNFGSMNMDEFLSSIWTAEENHMINSFPNNCNNNTHNINNNSSQFNLTETPTREKSIARQPSLPRQGSLTLPSPLCRKTVEEVWSEINKGQQEKQQQKKSSDKNVPNQEPATRQATFGEMTLEDFLVKAGVVRESVAANALLHPPPAPPQAQQQMQYGMYQSNNTGVGPGFVNQPVMGIGSGTGTAVGLNPYQTMPQGSAAVGESSAFVTNSGRNGVYPPQPQPVCYGGRMVNGGGGGYAPPPQPMAMPAPMSPVSSDGLGTSQVENSVSQYGLDMGALRGRKRIVDGPIEKVVERRQRRMIKNRESAARSRARKQAYTVELEAELNQLREENAQLKQALSEIERKRKQQYIDEMRARVHNKAYKAKERLKLFRRTCSGPL